MTKIDYKEIDAAGFEKFCTLISPTEDDKKREEKEYQDSIVPFRPAPPMPPSRYDRAIIYIKEFGLEENITLETISEPHSSECEINYVIFKNLKIIGNVEINFPALGKIEFVNNKFSDNVQISSTGANKIIVVFVGNKFLKSLDLHVTNISFTIIRNNDVFRSMGIFFTFIPSPNSTNSIIQNTQLIKWRADFSNNKISHLSISDISKTSDWRDAEDDYPLELIRFKGGNRIRILSIVTKHTALIPHLPLKSDVNRISFDASDKVGISTLRSDPTSNKGNKNPLIYGDFFSLLEAQASKQHDQVNEKIYKRKSRYFYRKFSPRWEDRFIFSWTNWFSKDGTSWVYPLFWLTLTEMIFAGIAYRFLVEWNPHYSWEESWRVFLTLFTWFMNPASLLPLPTPPLDPEEIAESWLIYVLFLFQKATVAVFYYEIVKVMRRFSKSIK